MHYKSVSEARNLGGLRLVLGAQTPGPWSLAARALFSLRNVPFVPVRQDVMMPNEELVAWTGRRNAPVAVYEDESAVDNWFDIMNLAERLGSGSSLFPDDPVERALAVGFSAEICGAGGFGWSRRIAMAASGPAEPGSGDDSGADVMRGYGVMPENIPDAERRTVGILRGLADQLHRQRDAGSDFLVGNRLSACDVHWACFSQLIEPLGEEAIEMDPGMRMLFEIKSREVAEASDPILIEHRELIWREHIGLPVDYLPE